MADYKLIEDLKKEGFILSYPEISSNDEIPKRNIFIFNKIILISYEIFKKEKIDSSFLEKIIKNFKIKNNLKRNELEYFYEEFKLSKELKKKKTFNKREFESRENLNILINLEKIFSPAKIRILKNIYEHKKLTPTEERYYYRSIKPFIDAILNNSVRNFLEIVLKNKSQR